MAKELMHEEHEFTVDELTKKIERLKKKLETRLHATIANVNTLVDFTIDEEKITLQDAIYSLSSIEEVPVLRKWVR